MTQAAQKQRFHPVNGKLHILKISFVSLYKSSKEAKKHYPPNHFLLSFNKKTMSP